MTEHKPDKSGYAETRPTQPMTDNRRPDPRKPGGEAEQAGTPAAAGREDAPPASPPGNDDPDRVREPTPAGDHVPGPIKEPERGQRDLEGESRR